MLCSEHNIQSDTQFSSKKTIEEGDNILNITISDTISRKYVITVIDLELESTLVDSIRTDKYI